MFWFGLMNGWPVNPEDATDEVKGSTWVAWV